MQHFLTKEGFAVKYQNGNHLSARANVMALTCMTFKEKLSFFAICLGQRLCQRHWHNHQAKILPSRGEAVDTRATSGAGVQKCDFLIELIVAEAVQ